MFPQILLARLVIIMTVVPGVMLRGESLSSFKWYAGFGYWFLPTLFFTTLLHMILTCYMDMKVWRSRIAVLLATIVAILLVLFVLDIPDGFFIKFVKLVPVAYAFYLLGYIFKETCLDLQLHNKFLEVSFLVSFPLLYVLSQWNGRVIMAWSDYGYFPLFLVTSCMGIFVVVEAMKHMKIINIFVEIGKMSIAVYVWNFLIVIFTKGILLRLLIKFDLYTSGVHAALTFLISVILLYLISKMTMKYIPWVYGVKNK